MSKVPKMPKIKVRLRRFYFKLTVHEFQVLKRKIRCKSGRCCCFLEGDMLLIPPNTRCDPIFGMEDINFLRLSITTPSPNIGSHCNVMDSYCLEENNIISPTHISNLNLRLANYRIGISTQ